MKKIFLFVTVAAGILLLIYLNKSTPLYSNLSPDHSLKSQYKLSDEEIHSFNSEIVTLSVPKFSPVGVLSGNITLPFGNETASFLFDNRYTTLSDEQLFKFVEWWKVFLIKNNIKHIEDSFDCDNFAPLFKNLLILTNQDETNFAQILVGTIIVDQKYSFAFVPAGDTWHMLNIVRTNTGWYVIEPQNGIYTSLNNYHNKILVSMF